MVSTVSERSMTTIQGEPAIVLERMPASWQRIATGDWMDEHKVYTAMAQVFLAKHQRGNVLFCERSESAHLKAAYCEGNGQLAYEAVEHYGEAFLPESYPDLTKIRQAIAAAESERNERATSISGYGQRFIC